MTKDISRTVSRRAMLRGAGVALALPWLESLAPRSAKAQAAAMPKRFIVIYLPNGTKEDYWIPSTTGQGASWVLSPILQPLQAFKTRMTVLSNMENYTAWSTLYNDLTSSHGRRPGCFLTCADVVSLQMANNGQDVNGISADQLIAQNAMYSTLTPLQSLQLGLNTSNNSCDGPPCSYSRNITWGGPTQPMPPEVDPGAAFDRIAGSAALQPTTTPGMTTTTVDPVAQQRAALNQSVIDAVLENSATVQNLLGTSDRAKMDEFLTAVRGAETRVTAVSATMQTGGTTTSAGNYTRPTLQAQFQVTNTPGGYDKGLHADAMNDMIAMAIETDTTRIITHMMENERSEFVYDTVPKLTYTATTSAPGTGVCGNYHGAQHGDQQEFASITQWNVQKVADLCAKLDAIQDGPGVSALDNSLIMLASCMDGGGHYGNQLPVALIGGASGTFKKDQHIAFQPTPNDRPLRDLYFTIMNGYFNIGATDFGHSVSGAQISMITELLA